MENLNPELLKEIVPREIDMVDDSFIYPSDKCELLKQLKELYTKKYEWADDKLVTCMVTWHYNEAIKSLDKNIYLEEKKEMLDNKNVVNIEDFLKNV